MSLINFKILRSRLAVAGLTTTLLTSRESRAFDAGGVASAAAGMAASYFSGGLLGGGGMDMEEMMGFAIAFTDLLEEFDIDADADNDIKDMNDKLAALDSKARTMEGEIKQLGPLAMDIEKNKNLTSKVKRIREMIKTTKTIAGLMKAMPKGGERALKVQDTRLNYMILDELMKISRAQYTEVLERKMRAAKFQLLLADLRNEERNL
ncbi:MAG: hypothetical protein EOP05_18495 [Proteobacteria bacterium]|nr:MAG: hypothetical protein EOP05_18495 [Pseudomonadota bacterium]